MRKYVTWLVACLVLLLLPAASVAADHRATTAGNQENLMVEKIYHLPAFGREFTGDLHGFAIVGGEHRIPANAGAYESLVKGADSILVRYYGAVEGPWPDHAPAGGEPQTGQPNLGETAMKADPAPEPEPAPPAKAGRGKG